MDRYTINFYFLHGMQSWSHEPRLGCFDIKLYRLVLIIKNIDCNISVNLKKFLISPPEELLQLVHSEYFICVCEFPNQGICIPAHIPYILFKMQTALHCTEFNKKDLITLQTQEQNQPTEGAVPEELPDTQKLHLCLTNSILPPNS